MVGRSRRESTRANLDADKERREQFSGYGSAIAHGHNYVILPLTSSRHKRTQVRSRRERSIEEVISSMRNYTGGKE